MGREDPRRASPHAVLTDYYDDEAQRRRFLTKLFDDTAPFYDHINNLMSFGSGAWYRRWALRRAGLGVGASILDVAVGTGEVARAALAIVGASGRVIGADPSAGMLACASHKLRIPLAQGVAEQLPFRDRAFDFVSMGYALRHVSDLRQLFREYHRVLRPGGTVLILDFARPRSRVGRALGRFYLLGVLPWLSRLRSGSEAGQILMRYCWDTVAALVSRETIVAAMAGCGFEDVTGTHRFGVLSEYVGRKPRTSRP